MVHITFLYWVFNISEYWFSI